MTTATTSTSKVISDKSAQAVRLISNANTKAAIKDVKRAAANDVDKEEVEEEVKSEIKAQNKHNDEKAVADATKKVNELTTQLTDAKAVLRKLTGKPAKSSEPKGPGVISTIFNLIKGSKKGISKADLLTKLVELFPDRSADGMTKTINVQLPKRMSTERKVNIVKDDKGLFTIK